MPPETRKLNTFANCSNSSSSFVNVKVLVYTYTGIIEFPCFIPQKDNSQLKQTFAQYGVNTPRSDRLGSKVRQRVHYLDATYVYCVLFKMMLSTADLWAKKIYFLWRTLLQNGTSCDR